MPTYCVARRCPPHKIAGSTLFLYYRDIRLDGCNSSFASLVGPDQQMLENESSIPTINITLTLLECRQCYLIIHDTAALSITASALTNRQPSYQIRALSTLNSQGPHDA